MIDITVPIKTTNPLNGSHRHWSVKSRQRKSQRTAVFHLVRMALQRQDIGLPVTCTVTRIAPSNGLDPHDGLGAALKGVIDGIADALGLSNDRDERVHLVLKQERGRPKEYAVRIQIEAR